MIQKTRDRIRLKDIAERAEISVSAVSMALADHPEISPETKQRVRQLSREMGYRRRRRISTAWRHGAVQPPDRFGFLLLGSRLEDESYSGMLRALTVGASAAGLRMEVAAIEDTGDRAVATQTALNYATGLDGLLLMGAVTQGLLSELENAGVAYVVLGHVLPEPGQLPQGNAQVVTSNEIGMGHMAATRLIAAGHSRIAFICEQIIDDPWHAHWLGGYTTALLQHQITPDPALIHVIGAADSDGESAAAAMVALSDPATAYVLPEPRLASNFIQAMKNRGHDLSKQAVIIGGQSYTVNRYGLQEYPQILNDLSRVAEVGLRHLRHLCEEPMAIATEVMVPFLHWNLP